MYFKPNDFIFSFRWEVPRTRDLNRLRIPVIGLYPVYPFRKKYETGWNRTVQYCHPGKPVCTRLKPIFT